MTDLDRIQAEFIVGLIIVLCAIGGLVVLFMWHEIRSDERDKGVHEHIDHAQTESWGLMEHLRARLVTMTQTLVNIWKRKPDDYEDQREDQR